MKFTAILSSTIFVASSIAAPSVQPFAIVTREDGTTSNVGGSVGCFGTDGNLVAANVTPGFQATLYSEDNCKGQVLIRFSNDVNFDYPINTKSIRLNSVLY